MKYMTTVFMRLPFAACHLLAAAVLLTACGAPSPLLLTKGRSFATDLTEVSSATGSLLAVTFYAHPMNPATGTVLVASGTCLCIDTGRGKTLVTAQHVVQPENERPLSLLGVSLSLEKADTRRFFFPAEAEVFSRIKTIHDDLAARGGPVGQVSRAFYENLFAPQRGLFHDGAEITDWSIDTLPRHDVATIRVPETAPPLETVALPLKRLADQPMIAMGRGVGVLGSPGSAGRQYREGVISRAIAWDHRRGEPFPDAFHLDIPMGDGDSGAPVLATRVDGRIEVIGMVVAAMPFSPRLGRAVSSGPIFSLLSAPQYHRPDTRFTAPTP